jgi:MFS family permease
LFFLGQMISLIGTWIQNVAQSWLAYILTGSPFYLGLISFASAVPILLVSLWAGIVADRVPKRNLLLLTQSTMMVLALVLAALAFPGWVQPWHIVVLSCLLGLANTFDALARQAFVIELVRREDLMNAIALNSALFNSARIIGPSLAGIVLGAFGLAWCFLLNGISFLAVIFGLTRMRVSDHPGPAVEHSPLTQLREGFQYVWRHRTVRTLIFMVSVSNLFASGYSVLLPAFARDVLGGSEITLGLLTTAVGVGALIRSAACGRIAQARLCGTSAPGGQPPLPRAGGRPGLRISIAPGHARPGGNRRGICH